MNKMQAIVKQSEGLDDFKLSKVPIPEISGNEMLVRVKAIGVGIHDGYFLPENIQYPYPIGIEASGIIEKVGGRVTGFKQGESIAFISAMQVKGGTWAEYAVVSGDSLIIPIPKGMSFVEAAAIPVAGNAALKALHALRLKENDTLFIAGASGAIGTLAIQIATQRGVIVAGSASEKNHEYMRALGAKKVVDYRDLDWTNQIKEWMPSGIDAVMAIQPNTGSTSMTLLKEGGRIVAVSGDQLSPNQKIIIEPFPYLEDVTQELVGLMRQILTKKIKLTIEAVYPFEKGIEALQKTRTRHARGKLVITMP